MTALLVYDGRDLVIPPQMFPSGGLPACEQLGQLQGTVGERLTELAGRICYDSLGRGRSSVEYHAHIRESEHTSVLRHYHVSFYLLLATEEIKDSLIGLRGIPGVYAIQVRSDTILVCASIQSMYEAGQALWNPGPRITQILQHIGRCEAPSYFADCPPPEGVYFEMADSADARSQWVSLYLHTSRLVSHELVRHSFDTAPSQRSTRYCDESKAQFIRHPLLPAVPAAWTEIEARAQEEYRAAVDSLEQSIRAQTKCDRQYARKQARGAARGILPGALETELIFSASVEAWKFILRKRLSPHADAGMFELAREIREELLKSRFAHSFAPRKDDDDFVR